MANETVANLREWPTETFLSQRILESVPFIFSDDFGSYVAWKDELGERIEVDPRAIQFIGSAGLGFSLNPYKNLKTFDSDSDIDLGIVSARHFDLAWHYLRNVGAKRFTWAPRAQAALRKHVEGHIYWGTIATDKLLGHLPFGKNWLEAFAYMSSIEPTTGRTLKARVYRDFDSLRSYQSLGAKQARSKLLAAGV